MRERSLPRPEYQLRPSEYRKYKDVIIGLLKEEDMMIQDIARACKRSVRHTRRFLDELKNENLIECYQKGRKWRWRLT